MQPWTTELLQRLDAGESVEALTAFVFRDGGPFYALGLDVRPAQRTLALAIARRCDEQGWVAADAPCGSGKGMAYLVPGVLHTLRKRRTWVPPKPGARPPRMVVSTANIALQDQLLTKDVPGVARLLGVPIRGAVLKGISNFVCNERLAEGLLLLNDRDHRDFDRLDAWLNAGGSGDRDEVTFPVAGTAWPKVTTDSQGCIREACRHYAPDEGANLCGWRSARLAADSADVVIVNHHYLAVASGQLHPVSFLAVDEAHALEDALRGSQTLEVRYGTALAVARASREVHGVTATRVVGEPFRRLVDAATEWCQRNRATSGRHTVTKGWTRSVSLADFDVVADTVKALDLLVMGAEDERQKARLESARDLVKGAYIKARTMLEGPDASQVKAHPGPWAIYIQPDGERAVLGACAVDIAPTVASLRRALPSASLTSATLAPGGDFGPLCVSLGLSTPSPTSTPTVSSPTTQAIAILDACVVVPSPYDLPNQGVLVVPDGPMPKDAAWQTWSVERIVDAVKGARGRTLVLCSSWSAMRRAAEQLRQERLPYPILVQGEAGRTELRAQFREVTHSVLVATRSFFEGVDVAGEACSCVVLDRVPFDVPGDPIEEATCNLAVQRAGTGSPFVLRSLPRACAALAQAAGRLIRSSTDRGVLVVLDRRVVERSPMGVTLRRALPPFPVRTDLAVVGHFLDDGTLPAETTPEVQSGWSVQDPGVSYRLRRPRPNASQERA
jgi:ATP-dependent DNA helicase DinG